MERDPRLLRPYYYTSLVVVLVWSITQTGCNLFGRLDPPGDRQDKYSAALAMANAGDCVGAKDLLESVQPPDDDIASALGWAYMCLAGATATNIATSLYSFSSSNQNKTVVGALARTMLPMDSEKAVNAQKASDAFAQIGDSRRRNLSTGISKFVQAAALLGQQARNASSTSLEKGDISPNSACANFTTSTACTTAAGSCGAGMSNTDVNSFIIFANAALTALGNIGGSSDLSSLASAITAGLSADDVGRCLIYNEMIPE